VTDIIDSHFHLWRMEPSQAAGILTDPRFKSEIAWSDYETARGDIALAGAVAVEVFGGEAELALFEAAAAEHPELKGIVANAPLEHEDVAAHLDRLLTHPLVRGVRRNTQDETDQRFCGRPDFIAGARAVGERGLICDICVRHWQLDGMIALAQGAPDTVFVLNHLGKPTIGGDLSDWREKMATLAECPNVNVKLSVVVHGTVAPVAGHVLALFGPDRVLWASNWPVAPLVTAYGDWLTLAQKLTEPLGPAAQAAVFHDNAARVYRIEV
jgi:L-fuconolactonase